MHMGCWWTGLFGCCISTGMPASLCAMPRLKRSSNHGARAQLDYTIFLSQNFFFFKLISRYMQLVIFKQGAYSCRRLALNITNSLFKKAFRTPHITLFMIGTKNFLILVSIENELLDAELPSLGQTCYIIIITALLMTQQLTKRGLVGLYVDQHASHHSEKLCWSKFFPLTMVCLFFSFLWTGNGDCKMLTTESEHDSRTKKQRKEFCFQVDVNSSVVSSWPFFACHFQHQTYWRCFSLHWTTTQTVAMH